MKRRLVVSLVLLVLLAFAAPLAWTLLGWPPPDLVLKYGISPYCTPTGKTMEVEGIEFVEIGPGCFRMGSHYKCEKGDLLGRVSAIVGLDWGTPPRHDSNECPPHWVEFEQRFWIATMEITNEQFERFNPEHRRNKQSQGDRDPVVCVSWMDATDFCIGLTERSGHYSRLPSEAEWECACRAGNSDEYCFGSDFASLRAYAWYTFNSGGQAHEVGGLKANSWGLFDFHGNVWEWCEDTYHDGYNSAPTNGSSWTRGGLLYEDTATRVQRGGGWESGASHCRSSHRRPSHPASWFRNVGFRPVIVEQPVPPASRSNGAKPIRR